MNNRNKYFANPTDEQSNTQAKTLVRVDYFEFNKKVGMRRMQTGSWSSNQHQITFFKNTKQRADVHEILCEVKTEGL